MRGLEPCLLRSIAYNERGAAAQLTQGLCCGSAGQPDVRGRPVRHGCPRSVRDHHAREQRGGLLRQLRTPRGGPERPFRHPAYRAHSEPGMGLLQAWCGDRQGRGKGSIARYPSFFSRRVMARRDVVHPCTSGRHRTPMAANVGQHPKRLTACPADPAGDSRRLLPRGGSTAAFRKRGEGTPDQRPQR